MILIAGQVTIARVPFVSILPACRRLLHVCVAADLCRQVPLQTSPLARHRVLATSLFKSLLSAFAW